MSGERFDAVPKNNEERMSKEDYNGLVVDTFDEKEQAVMRELRGRNLESVIADLPPLDAVVLRLNTGALSDVPMRLDAVASMFKADSPKSLRLRRLNEIGTAALEERPSDPDFDKAMLSLLGYFPKESIRFPNNVIAKVTGRSGAFVRNSLSYAMAFLKQNSELIKESPDASN